MAASSSHNGNRWLLFTRASEPQIEVGHDVPPLDETALRRSLLVQMSASTVLYQPWIGWVSQAGHHRGPRLSRGPVW